MLKNLSSDCENIRTKMSYIDINEEDNWRSESSCTYQYWCLRTMNSTGPDNNLVSPATCNLSRNCYKASVFIQKK